ncbi:hypothetical protein M2284_000327 [Rhodococcus sp. LBL1]|nr:hypothetical protein [Rhodococcus sp. LBL1]MDH6681425.1 hypothetical protein [Rhodococcus sp. LBL2]
MASIENLFKGIFAGTGSLDAVKGLFHTISGSVSNIFGS